VCTEKRRRRIRKKKRVDFSGTRTIPQDTLVEQPHLEEQYTKWSIVNHGQGYSCHCPKTGAALTLKRYHPSHDFSLSLPPLSLPSAPDLFQFAHRDLKTEKTRKIRTTIAISMRAQIGRSTCCKQENSYDSAPMADDRLCKHKKINSPFRRLLDWRRRPSHGSIQHD